MTVTIHDEDKETTMNRVANQRLYLTADKSRVVTEGDPAAAILLAAGPGDEIPAEYADLEVDDAFLQGEGDAEDETPDDDEPTEKKATKPADKAVKKQTNK